MLDSGDEHNSYNIAEYDHVEPVWGIFSNSSLDVDTVFPDDVLVHGSDWDQNGYYRPFSTLVDSPKNGNVLTGNCSIAVPWGGGPNEVRTNHTHVSRPSYHSILILFCTIFRHAVLQAYPCVMNDIDYGYAISGFVDPMQRAIPTSLSVNGGGTEPQGSSVDLTATLLVAGPLTVGATYTIYRFDGTANFPTDSQFERGNSSASFPFVAQASTFQMVDPVTIPSASAVYYVTIATKQ